MSDKELKPCPFCGSTELYISPPCNDPPDYDILLNSYQVVCRYCHCCGSSTGEYEDVIELWNRRANDGR